MNRYTSRKDAFHNEILPILGDYEVCFDDEILSDMLINEKVENGVVYFYVPEDADINEALEKADYSSALEEDDLVR